MANAGMIMSVVISGEKADGFDEAPSINVAVAAPAPPLSRPPT